MREGPPDRLPIDTHCLAAAGPTVVAGTYDGIVFRSGDGGDRWEVLAEGLPAVNCAVVA